jgi:protein TonB
VLARESIRTWSVAFALSALIHLALAGALSGQSWMMRDFVPPRLVSLPVDLVEPSAREEPPPVPSPPRPAPLPRPIETKPLVEPPPPRPIETRPIVEPPPPEMVKRVEAVPDSPPAPPPAPVETPQPSSAPPRPAPALSVETDRNASKGATVALPESRQSTTAEGTAPGSAGATSVASVPRSDTGSSSSAPSSGTSGTSGRGITQWAHPQGGYQVHPSYPASARRLGIQGTARLRVQVLADGHVGEIVVESSAGHADLDRAAAEAVRQWRFEPARRGTEPVATWVLLPVQFQLKRGE